MIRKSLKQTAADRLGVLFIGHRRSERGGSKIAAVVLFVALCALGRRMTRKDPNISTVRGRVPAGYLYKVRVRRRAR